MTFVGHTLTGLSIAALCVPRRWRRPAKGAFLAAFALLATVPDWPTFEKYAVRHSIFVNLGLMAVPVAVLAAWKWLRARIGGWRVILCGAAAWLSHLLMDSLYSTGAGVPILWPVSKFRLDLPIAWFVTMHPGEGLSRHNLRVWAVEALFYGALLLACVLLRRWQVRRAGDRPL